MADVRKTTCKQCDELKPVDAFWAKKTKKGTSYTDGTCKDCRNAEKRKAHKGRVDDPAYRHRRKMNNIKSRYGLSREQYIDLMLKQDFRCPICTDPVDAGEWFVDHDHTCCPGEMTCGECVRSLLDNKCNTLLGHAGDNIATLTRAQAYLEVSGA